MNRGRRAEKIFVNQTDYKIFVELLQESAENWNINVAAYCLIPNYYHILINTPEANISRNRRHLNGVYTQGFDVTSWMVRCSKEDTNRFLWVPMTICYNLFAIFTRILLKPGWWKNPHNISGAAIKGIFQLQKSGFGFTRSLFSHIIRAVSNGKIQFGK
ncbi:hypothetical protein ACFL0M_00140 [Thermodesulfobacteriota bacterium]